MTEHTDSGKKLQRWADKAMFEAEPIDDVSGPKVYLISMNADPLGDIAAADMLYAGRVIRDLSEVTDEERIYHFTELMKTRLKAPLEFVSFHFLIEGVTRAFTHQLVRQRTATYVQESMRFAVKEDMPTALPPSLQGTIYHGRGEDYDDTFERLAPRNQQRIIWEEAMEHVEDAYKRLIDMGMPAEDARGLAPTNVLTRIHYRTDLHALLDHAGNRLCTQAQFEWRLVFSRIAAEIRNAEVRVTLGNNLLASAPVKMAEELGSHFRPICYHTGKCEFMANVDRECSIRDRVEQNHRYSIPSTEWDADHRPSLAIPGNQAVSGPLIAGIDPREWLLNPSAAR